MARFRIRFQLQELDIAPGVFLIGRAGSCQLTVDDPLASRNHARLVVTEDEATIEDLNSRNGVRVNGRLLTEPHPLADGDRIRIGTQQIILRKIEDSDVRNRRATGFMIHCSGCGVPYDTNEPSCPNCGEGASNTLVVEEPTTTTAQSAWNLELLAETLQKARALGRRGDVHRILVRAREELEHTTIRGDERRVEQLAAAAVEFAVDTGDIGWADWGLRLYARYGVVPRREVGQKLSLLPASDRSTLAPAASAVVLSVRPEAGGREGSALDALEEMVREGER